MDSCIQNSNFIQSHMITCKKFLSWSVAALVSIGQESHRISWVAVKILRVPPDLITIQHSRSSEKIFWFEPPLQPKATYTSEFIQVVANTFTSKVNFTMQDMRKPANYRAIQLSSCLRRRQRRERNERTFRHKDIIYIGSSKRCTRCWRPKLITASYPWCP